MTSPVRRVARGVTSSTDAVIAGLHAQRERRLADVAALQRAFAEMVAASEGSNADDEHDPEGATIAFERTQLSAQIAHARADLDAVDEAMARVRTGHYGSCESCGRPIASARLEARPTATTCITCASR